MISLEEAFEWYLITKDGYKFIAKVLKKEPILFTQLAPHTFEPISEFKQKLYDSIQELEDQALVLMVSVFERLVTDRTVKCILGDKQKQNKLGQLCEAVKNYCAKELERRSFKDILDLFKITVQGDLVGLVKQIYDYRNWVAHGKRGPKPLSITPGETYKRLSKFLEEAGILD